MANNENLIPVTKRTPRERKAISSKGGKASAEAKRKRKALKEELIALLDVIDTNGHSVQEKISFALIKEACDGNVKAFEVIRDTIGEKPIDKVEQIKPPVIKIERPDKK